MNRHERKQIACENEKLTYLIKWTHLIEKRQLSRDNTKTYTKFLN